MKLVLTYSAADVQLVKDFCNARRDKKLVQFRISKNLNEKKSPVKKDRFWRALVCMRLTSRQKSGPNSAVTRLISKRPFPLAIEKVEKSGNSLESFIASELKAISGMRDYDVAARQLARNFQMLEAGEWSKFIDLCNSLRFSPSASMERSAANNVATTFKGFGPKQSRNFLQALGLTKYEIPLDSRVMKWLRDELKFPLPISSGVLADKDYYEFVLDEIQKLCEQAEEYPCILDAAIFSEGDDDSWTSEMMDF